MWLIHTPTCSGKPCSLSLIVLEFWPLLPDFGFSLNRQTSLWLTGELVGWISVPSGPWCFEIWFGWGMAGQPLAPPKVTSIYGQVRSLVDSIFLWIYQWIAWSILCICFLKLNWFCMLLRVYVCVNTFCFWSWSHSSTLSGQLWCSLHGDLFPVPTNATVKHPSEERQN